MTQPALGGDRPSSVMDVLERCLGWPSHLISLVFLVWLCWYARMPSMPWGVLLFYAFWMLFFLLWLVLRIATWVDQREKFASKPWLKWAITPAILVLGFVVSYSGIVCRLCFEMNRPTFDRLAHEAMASPNSVADVRTIGIYQIEGVQYVPPGSPTQEAVIFYIAPFGHHVGFVYYPTSKPQDFSSHKNLGGGWYTFGSYAA